MGESISASFAPLPVKRKASLVVRGNSLTLQDEPRRSSRANKGSNSDRWQEVLDSARQNIVHPESNAGDTATDAGTIQTDNKQDNEDNTEDDQIRCVCGQTSEVEDEDKDFVQCDQCLVWQHNQCVGLPSEIPENQDYFCELCRPDLHEKLLKDIAQGKKFGKDRKRKRTVDNKKKSRATSSDPVLSDGDVSSQAQLKRRRSSSSSDVTIVSDGSDIVDAKTRKSSGVAGPGKTMSTKSKALTTKGRSSVINNKHSGKSGKGKRAQQKSVVTSNSPFRTLDEIHDSERKKIAAALVKLVGDTITIATETEGFLLSSNVSADEEALSLGLQIEFAMFDAHLDVRTKFRQLSFNLKDPKNPSLRKSVLDRTLTPAELVQMSSEDMANPELKAKTEALREESLKQSVLVQETGPRIRRTHKGEEYVEGPDASIETSAAVAPSAGVRPREGSDSPLSERTASSMQNSGVNSPESPKLQRRERSDSNFDINNVWDHMETPEAQEPAILHRRQSRPDSAMQSNANDNDEDLLGLLNDDQEMKSIKTYNYASNEQVWTGQVDMPGVVDLTATASLLGGPRTFNVDWTATLTACIRIDGRIPKPDASKYLCHQKFSQSKNVFVVQLRPQSGKEAAFNNLYSYFMKKERYGVIKPGDTRLRDGYIVPLPVNSDLPEFITMLPSFNLPADRSDLLLAVLVVEKSAAPAAPAPATTTVAAAAITATPVAAGNTPPIPTPSPQKNADQPRPEPRTVSATPSTVHSTPRQQQQQQQQQQQPFTIHQWQTQQPQYLQTPPMRPHQVPTPPMPMQAPSLPPRDGFAMPLEFDQRAQAVLMAFLRAHPEIASNQQVVSSPHLMARLLDEFVRNGGMLR